MPWKMMCVNRITGESREVAYGEFNKDGTGYCYQPKEYKASCSILFFFCTFSIILVSKCRSKSSPSAETSSYAFVAISLFFSCFFFIFLSSFYFSSLVFPLFFPVFPCFSSITLVFSCLFSFTAFCSYLFIFLL